MAASVKLPLVLTSRNAVTLLQPLSVEQTKQLIFHLGIELNVLDDILTQHKGDSFKMHAFQTWLNYDVEASWDKVISGLKMIGMNTLAEKVSTKAQVLVNVSPSIDQESSAIVSPVESVDTSAQTQVARVTTVVPHAAASNSQESFIPSTCSSTVDNKRVAEVKDCIDQLEDAFSDLISDTRSSMSEKESQDRKFLDRLRDHLLVLPITKKATHAKFFKENEDDIIKAESVRRLFAILSRYCNYSNYEILFHLVKYHLVKYHTVEYHSTPEVAHGDSLLHVTDEQYAYQLQLEELNALDTDIQDRSREWKLALQAESDEKYARQLQDEEELEAKKERPQYQENKNDINSQLRDASKEGDVVRVASLLNLGVELDGVDKFLHSPLDLASWFGHLHTVRLLLNRGAFVDVRDQEHWSPLISAAFTGRYDVVVELLDRGADVNAQTVNGTFALMGAAKEGQTNVVAKLLKAGANLNLENSLGNSALMVAAMNGRTEVVIQLVEAGANLNLQNMKGDSVVIIATAKRRSGALRRLVTAGADLNLQNEEGLTALMISARTGSTDLTDILLAGDNLNLDIQENSTGWSALFFSADIGDVPTTESLLKAGANAYLKDKNGLTPLDIATAKDMDEVCQVLHRHIQASTMSGPVATTDQERPTPSPDDTSSYTTHQDTSRELIPATRQIRVSQVLRNLVNSSGNRIAQLFNQLNRRLKSVDNKRQSGSHKQ